MKQVPNFNLGGQGQSPSSKNDGQEPEPGCSCQRHHPGSGEQLLLVTVPCVDGSVVTYAAHPFIEWRFSEKPNGLQHSAQPVEASPATRLKAAFDVVADFLATAAPLVESSTSGGGPVSPEASLSPPERLSHSERAHLSWRDPETRQRRLAGMQSSKAWRKAQAATSGATGTRTSALIGMKFEGCFATSWSCSTPNTVISARRALRACAQAGR